MKVKASVKATLGDFQMDRIGDAKAALKYFDQALDLRRQWLAREPSNDEAKRGVANILGALARARLRLGDPATARALYREEIELRDQFSPAQPRGRSDWSPPAAFDSYQLTRSQPPFSPNAASSSRCRAYTGDTRSGRPACFSSPGHLMS